MRIISQNGMIDVPYDLVALHCSKEKVRLNMAGDAGKGTIIATYSTSEKVERAMRMLHEEYTKLESEKIYQADEFLPKYVFRFPKEDEVI